MSNYQTLLPCPFCGDQDPELVRPGTNRVSCQVECTNCGASLESSDVGEHSGSSWNRRPSFEKLKRKHEDLQDKISACETDRVLLWNQVKWFEKRSGENPISASHNFTETGLHVETLKRISAALEADQARLSGWWNFGPDPDLTQRRIGYLEALAVVEKTCNEEFADGSFPALEKK